MSDYETLLANLTATQERCNELLEEARAARRERDAYKLAAQLLGEELRIVTETLEGVLDFEEVPDSGSVN